MEEKSIISCSCGKFQGAIKRIECGTRAICYCHDCQMYAHYLPAPNKILNSFGGTEVIAVRPSQLTIICGSEYLSCISLTEFGSLRFFTHCCHTPICNMSRQIYTSHIALIHSCLSGNVVRNFFGENVLHVKRSSAIGIPPKNKPVQTIIASLQYAYSIASSCISGGYKFNPFINQATKKYIVSPIIITEDELRELKMTAKNWSYNKIKK